MLDMTVVLPVVAGLDVNAVFAPRFDLDDCDVEVRDHQLRVLGEGLQAVTPGVVDATDEILLQVTEEVFHGPGTDEGRRDDKAFPITFNGKEGGCVVITLEPHGMDGRFVFRFLKGSVFGVAAGRDAVSVVVILYRPSAGRRCFPWHQGAVS